MLRLRIRSMHLFTILIMNCNGAIPIQINRKCAIHQSRPPDAATFDVSAIQSPITNTFASRNSRFIGEQRQSSAIVPNKLSFITSTKEKEKKWSISECRTNVLSAASFPLIQWVFIKLLAISYKISTCMMSNSGISSCWKCTNCQVIETAIQYRGGSAG